MRNSSAALGLLAVATLLWSASGLARARLAAVGGRAGSRKRWRWATHRMVLPAGFAAAMGALTGVLCGWPAGGPAGCAVAGVAWLAATRVLGRSSRAGGNHDQLGLAAGWDLLAACLRSGLPVPTAVCAVADHLPADVGQVLTATAD